MFVRRAGTLNISSQVFLGSKALRYFGCPIHHASRLPCGGFAKHTLFTLRPIKLILVNSVTPLVIMVSIGRLTYYPSSNHLGHLARRIRHAGTLTSKNSTDPPGLASPSLLGSPSLLFHFRLVVWPA